MSAPTRVLIPESAPFSPEQRAWLSGFLAAAVVPDTQLPDGLLSLGAPSANAPTQALASNDDAPWHDPAMAIDDRMKLADGRPLAPRIMAAMAQQDCGQCGYNCADYANAISTQAEEKLNLCAPGGKETARMLKKLAEELGAEVAPAAGVEPQAAASVPLGELGRARDNPALGQFLARRRISGEGSEKSAWHIDFDISKSNVSYQVGDSFGVFVANDLGLVDQIIALLGMSHQTDISGKTLRDVLKNEKSLGVAPDALFELYSFISGGPLREKARALARGEDPDGDAAQLDVMAVVQKFANVRPHAEAFVDALEPLQPRLYSISSSPNATPGRVSLTVDAVRYQINKRRRLGVASTYLAERVAEGADVSFYIQAAHNFALPQDRNIPIIMIGPGTGIAPFRAFLLDRQATGATGKNWLFFGHQKQATDFFYQDELSDMQKSGHLTRLSLAWSRDGSEKFYVQDRMRQVGASVWQWISEGAHIYVCGDAKRMAKDVEVALVDIVAQHGVRTTDEAVAFVGQLKKTGRYQADVY